MATGSSDQHYSYVRNQNDGSFGKGRNQMSSQQNYQCAYNETIHVPHYTDPALLKHPDIFAPGQHAELRISRAPISEMESYPYYLENFRDPNYSFREAEAPKQELTPGRGPDDVVPLTSIQKQLTRYGCYSIPSSRTVMAYPAGQCLPTLHEEIFHVQNNAYPSCLYPKAEEPSEKNTAFPSCLYPKQVKLKLNVRPLEKPPEPMESGEMVKHRDRNVRVSLMASTASPEQISFKLLHEEPVLEPEPENIAMPLEIMPSPPPPDEVVEVKFLPVGDSYKAHAKQYFRSCLGVSRVVMRALGIGAYVSLAMAHQFALFSVKVLKNGLHVYGPVVAKATVSSYKGLRKEMMKQCLACFPSDIDAEYELESFDEIHQPGSNRPSHHDNECAWKESLRLYPEPKEDPEPKSDSEVSCSQEECMAGNSQDKPTPELSVLEDCSHYSHQKDCTSQHNKKRLSSMSKRNSDKISSTVPFKEAGTGYSPDSLSRVRKRLSLSSIRNNQRENFRIQGLGALVWPPPDIRRFSDPIRGHQFIPNLAVRPGTKNYRDLIQEPPLEDEFIWRRTLRAYFRGKGADVRPEDVLLCRQAAPMKEEFERNKEDPMMPDRDGRLGLGGHPCYSDHLEAGELSYPSYSTKQPNYQHIKQPPLLQISHGDNIVHHCVPNRKSRTHELPNRGKDNKELGHPSLAHLKHDNFGSVGKSRFDDSEKLMKNEASSGISSIHFRMKDEDFWQAKEIHSSESNWKSLRGSEAPHPHGKKRPHSPGPDSMEELPHSREAAGKSINSSRAHPHGKHQKLEVMSAPDSLIQAKFSKRPLRISKPKLSSDRSKFDSPAESRQSGRSLKTKPLDSRQSTPLKERPPFHIPKVSQNPRKVLADRDVSSAHIPFSNKHSHSIPSSPVKSLDHTIPSDFRLKSPDLFPRGRNPLLINRRSYYLRIHPQPSENPYKSAWRTPIINGDGGVSRTSPMRQPSADDLKRKGRFFYKRPRSRAPFKSYAPDSEGKSKPSLFKNGLSFLRDSLSSKILRLKSAREDDKPHPSTQSSFWNLPLEGKFQFFTLKKSRPAPRPYSPRMPQGKIHDHSNVGDISHGKKRDQGLAPFQSQGSQKEPKRRPLYENIPRLKIFLSKKDPHGIRSLSQAKCRQHGTVLRILNSSKKNPSSAGGDKRTKINSKVPKILKKDVPQVSPRSCISFLYPIAPAKRKSVDRKVRGRSSTRKKTANSGITPSSPGKMSKGPNTQGAKARSLSPSPSKRRRKVRPQKPMRSQHRRDNYAPIGSELTSIDGTNTSHICEDQISDMDIERTSKPKPEDAASERNYAENLSPAAVTLSTVRDTIESVNVDNADMKPASTTAETSDSTVLQPSEMIMDRGDEDGDDASSDSPYRLNPEISTLLTSYRQALIKEARKEPKLPSTGRLESERQQDSETELHSKADSAQWPYQQSSNFDEPTFSPLSELFQDVSLQTLESTSKETLNFDVDSETSLLDSFKEGIESIEPHDEHTSDVDHTAEGEDDSIALENFDEQKRGVDRPGEGEGALENYHRTLPAHVDKPELHRDEIQFYSPDEIIVSPTNHSFAESDKQNRGVDYPGEGDGALDNHHRTLPAHLDKQEPWDETHFYSADGMNLPPTDDSFANNGQQDRGVDPPLKDEVALEDHHRTLPARIDKVEQRDEAYFYSPDGMNLSSSDHSFAESSHQNRDVDPLGEGDSALENHHRTLPFHFDKDEHRDKTHFYSPDGMNFSPTDHSFSESSQQNRSVDHAGEGAGTLDIHQPKLLAPSDEHDLEDETHFSSPVGMNSSPIDHSFADSGQLRKDEELFQTLDQLEPVYGQKDLGHLNEGYDQGEKSPASQAVDQTLAESQVDERLPSEDHHLILEYTTIIRGVKESPRQADDGHDQGEKSSAALPIDQPFALPNETLKLLDQTPPPSNDVSDSRLFNVEIDTLENIIINSNEDEEPGHGTKDEGQMSMISEHVDNQGKDKIEQIEEGIHFGYPTSRPPYLDQDDSKNSPSISIEIIKRTIIVGDKPKNEKRKAREVVSRAEEELDNAAGRYLPPVELDVEDDDNSKHKTPSELGNQSPSLVISEIFQDLHYLSNPVKKDEPLHRQEFQIDPQEEPADVSSLPPRLLHDALQIEKDQKFEEPVKPEHHDKLLVERDEADYGGIKERGEFSQSIESTYHQRPRVGDGEDDRQSSVSSESQRSNTERDTTPRSAMIDENFPKLKFSEKLVAWEMLARTYQPPAIHNGPSDDLATVVTVTSQHNQPSPESPQVRGLDLAKPSIEKASKEGHFDYENSIARPKRTKDTLELSREYAAEEESPLTTDDQSSSDVHNLALDSTTTIRGEQESPLEHQADKGHDNSSKTSSASLPIDQPLILPTTILQQSNQTAPPSNDISRPRLFDVEIDVVEESIFDNDEYGEQGHQTEDEGQMSMSTEHEDNEEKEKIEQVEGGSHLGSPSSRSTYSNQNDSENSPSNSEKLFMGTIIEGDRARKEERKAWEVVSSAEQELDDNARSLPPLDVKDDFNGGFESESDSDALEGKAENTLASLMESEFFVSPQLSLSESYETASEQGFATTSDSEEELHRSRSFEGLLLESRPSSPSDGKNFAPPARSRRSVFKRPALKKSLIRTSGNEQTFAALQQLQMKPESPPTNVDSFPSGSSSQGSSDGTSTPPARSRSSVFIRPVLKMSLVQNTKTEQMFAQLGSEKSSQIDQPSSTGIEDNASSKQIDNFREAEVRRSSSFDGLGGSSDGRGSGSAPKRRSLFTRPVLKKSLEGSDETEKAFSRFRSEQSDDELRFDVKDGVRENGYQSDSLLDEKRSESTSSSRSTSQGSDENFIPPAGSRKRKSLFTRPFLKPSLVATSETKELFSRLQVEQNKDTGNEEGFDNGPEGGMRRSASFEGIARLDSSNSSQGLDRILMPARARKSSLFTRPILKPSLVSNKEQNEIEERQSSSEQRLDTREGGGTRRSSGFEGPTGLKDPIILDEMAVPRRGPRGSLLRSSVISTSESQEEDEAELSVSSAFKAGLESGASSQLLEGTSNFPPELSEESEGKTTWKNLSRGPDALDQPRRSALKRSSVGTLDAEQSINEQTIRKSVNFDPSFIKDTFSDSEARSSASEASESFET